MLVHVGPMLGPFGHVEPKFGNFADSRSLKNVEKTRDSRAKMANPPPPKLKLNSYCNCIQITCAWKNASAPLVGFTKWHELHLVFSWILRVLEADVAKAEAVQGLESHASCPSCPSCQQRHRVVMGGCCLCFCFRCPSSSNLRDHHDPPRIRCNKKCSNSRFFTEHMWKARLSGEASPHFSMTVPTKSAWPLAALPAPMEKWRCRGVLRSDQGGQTSMFCQDLADWLHPCFWGGDMGWPFIYFLTPRW